MKVTFPLSKNAINNPKWELPLRSKDGGKSISKKRCFTPWNSIQSHTQIIICSTLFVLSWFWKPQRKIKTFSFDPNSFLNVRFQPITPIGMVYRVTVYTFCHALLFSYTALFYKQSSCFTLSSYLLFKWLYFPTLICYSLRSSWIVYGCFHVSSLGLLLKNKTVL